MLLSVIGAGPAYTDRPGATGASYLLRADGSSLLLDLGQGSFARLAGLVDPADLDAVVISHLHPDHFIDLVPLRHYLRYERSPRAGPGRRPGRAGRTARRPARRARASAPSPSTSRRWPRGRSPSDRSGRGRAGDPHGRELRLPRLARRPTRTGRPRLLGRLRPRRGPRCPRATGRHAAVRGLVRAGSGPAGRAAPRWPGGRATWPRACAAGRVLLTHLQMGYDRDATVESVRAPIRRRTGRARRPRLRDDDRGLTARLGYGDATSRDRTGRKRPRHPTRGGAPRSDAARGRGA